jgi:hypothetical protein
MVIAVSMIIAKVIYDPVLTVCHLAVQVNETMFILFGLDSTNTSLSDINALDTVNWQWVQQFSVSGYKQQSNNSYPAAINGSSSSTDGSSGSGLGSGAIAGIAVGAVVVVVSVNVFFIIDTDADYPILGRHRSSNDSDSTPKQKTQSIYG